MSSLQPIVPCDCGAFIALAASTVIEVHLKDGTSISLSDGCLSCGALFGANTGKRIRNDDLKRLWLGYRLGSLRSQKTPYALPSWSDPVLGAPPKVSNQLFQGWRGLKPGARRGILETRLEVANGRKVATTQLPGLPRVGYDSRVVSHMLESENGNGDHVMYAPLLRRTLDEPDSVWNKVHDDRPDQLLYLKRYMVGSEMVTHVAVVDAPGEFVRTAYRLTRHPVESYRFGVLQYSAMALFSQ